jgi:hypothetical protein
MSNISILYVYIIYYINELHIHIYLYLTGILFLTIMEMESNFQKTSALVMGS